MNDPKTIIKTYLDNRAAADPLFASSYAKPAKSIDECYRYVLGEAKKRGSSVCMTDEEVYGLAVHYYDEDNIVINHTAAATVSTSRHAPAPELNEEEKAAAREEARRRYEQECYKQQEAKARERKQAAAKEKKQKEAETAALSPSLFTFDD